jgi:hypothetical protein
MDKREVKSRMKVMFKTNIILIYQSLIQKAQSMSQGINKPNHLDKGLNSDKIGLILKDIDFILLL